MSIIVFLIWQNSPLCFIYIFVQAWFMSFVFKLILLSHNLRTMSDFHCIFIIIIVKFWLFLWTVLLLFFHEQRFTNNFVGVVMVETLWPFRAFAKDALFIMPVKCFVSWWSFKYSFDVEHSPLTPSAFISLLLCQNFGQILGG